LDRAAGALVDGVRVERLAEARKVRRAALVGPRERSPQRLLNFREWMWR
jgi:hypothetical protein